MWAHKRRQKTWRKWRILSDGTFEETNWFDFSWYEMFQHELLSLFLLWNDIFLYRPNVCFSIWFPFEPAVEKHTLRTSADLLSFWTFFFFWRCYSLRHECADSISSCFKRTVYQPVSHDLMPFMQHRNCSTQFMTPCMFWDRPFYHLSIIAQSKSVCLTASPAFFLLKGDTNETV